MSVKAPAAESSASVIFVDAAAGRRGLYDGRLYVPDLPTALQLASRRGGVIQLAPGDYWPPADKPYYDIRLLGTTARQLVIIGSSPGTGTKRDNTNILFVTGIARNYFICSGTSAVKNNF